MGEKLKELGEFNLGNAKVHIELNKAYSSDYKYDIHLQTDKCQFSMKDGDFIKFASAIKKAKMELVRSKDVESSN